MKKRKEFHPLIKGSKTTQSNIGGTRDTLTDLKNQICNIFSNLLKHE
jgi:hypothetical protein